MGRRTYRDWDIANPDLRRKWDAGEIDDFYPYGTGPFSMQRLILQMTGAVDPFAERADGSDR